MAEPKNPITGHVGEVLDVSEGTAVVRPNHDRAVISGTQYVLDMPGTFIIGTNEVVAS